MGISASQQQKLFQWFEDKGVQQKCLACGHDQLQVGDLIASPPTPQGGGTVAGGPSYPVIQVVCKHCAFVMHFASTPIGLQL